MTFTAIPIEERFWAKVSPEPTSGCWLWIGSSSPLGYGSIMFNGRVQKAPRVSWQLHRGPIPEGKQVLHRCDNPPCVNPAHLFLGGYRENIADMVAKGRHCPQRGEFNGRAKLTAAEVAAIRTRVQAGESQRELAQEYEMSYQTIYLIVHRKLWRHAEEESAR